MKIYKFTIQFDTANNTWKDIRGIYEKMPGWRGYIDNTPVWESFDDPTKSISISVLSTGLVIEGNMGGYEFNIWVNEFCKKVTRIVDFSVK